MHRTSDLNVIEYRSLPTPTELLAALPKTAAQSAFVHERRQVIRRILSGEDRRLLMIVGPCSIHDLDAGREYARRLAALADELDNRLVVVMRAYFEKPRTTTGWKGLLLDPHLDGTCDVIQGLQLARQFLRDVLDLGPPPLNFLIRSARNISPISSAGQRSGRAPANRRPIANWLPVCQCPSVSRTAPMAILGMR